MTVRALLEQWRADVQHADRYADVRAVTITRLHIEQLEDALRAEQDQLLTRAQAVEEYDVHPDTLTRHAREGALPNQGRPHAPRYRRGDLTALGLKPRPRSERVAKPSAPAGTSPSLLSFTRRVQAKRKEG